MRIFRSPRNYCFAIAILKIFIFRATIEYKGIKPKTLQSKPSLQTMNIKILVTSLTIKLDWYVDCRISLFTCRKFNDYCTCFVNIKQEIRFRIKFDIKFDFKIFFENFFIQ